jgi:hypothetical protein
VPTAELEIVVLVELCEIVDDVAVAEDETVVVRTDDEADCVTVLLLAVITLLVADDVPFELPLVMLMTELFEDVEVGEAVVVPFELPLVVLITELFEDVDVGEAVVVPLDVKTGEDEEIEVVEAVVVPLDVKTGEDEGIEVDEVLPYGAPLEMVLETIPLDGPVV